jgi:hypothetical protein
VPRRTAPTPAELFDGQTLARGWLSVAIASASDPERPALHRTVCVEQFPTGVRLVATDSYILLGAWVPTVADEFATEPGPDEAPVTTHVVMDDHRRARSLFEHVLALTTKKDADAIEVRLRFATDYIESAFPGMEPGVAIIEYPGKEKLALELYEGDFPSWRKVEAGFAATKTDAIALNPDLVARLVKLGKLHASPLLWRFGGRDKAALVDVEGSPPIHGLAMPMRWDFALNEPRPEKAKKSEGEEE